MVHSGPKVYVYPWATRRNVGEVGRAGVWIGGIGPPLPIHVSANNDMSLPAGRSCRRRRRLTGAYRIALSNRVASSTAIPSRVGIEMRNIASMRVPAIGANHISMSRACLR